MRSANAESNIEGTASSPLFATALNWRGTCLTADEISRNSGELQLISPESERQRERAFLSGLDMGDISRRQEGNDLFGNHSQPGEKPP